MNDSKKVSLEGFEGTAWGEAPKSTPVVQTATVIIVDEKKGRTGDATWGMGTDPSERRM